MLARLTWAVAAATTEAVAIQRDILARTRARQDIPQKALRWLEQAQAELYRMTDELHGHRGIPPFRTGVRELKRCLEQKAATTVQRTARNNARNPSCSKWRSFVRTS